MWQFRKAWFVPTRLERWGRVIHCMRLLAGLPKTFIIIHSLVSCTKIPQLCLLLRQEEEPKKIPGKSKAKKATARFYRAFCIAIPCWLKHIKAPNCFWIWAHVLEQMWHGRTAIATVMTRRPKPRPRERTRRSGAPHVWGFATSKYFRLPRQFAHPPRIVCLKYWQRDYSIFTAHFGFYIVFPVDDLRNLSR